VFLGDGEKEKALAGSYVLLRYLNVKNEDTNNEIGERWLR
jgi:hypothetical protein